MRQTVVVVTCDACKAWKHKETSEGVETVPTAGGHTLDLCAEHREGMRAVLALIAEWGNRAGAGKVTAARKLSSSTNGNEPAAVENGNGGKRTRRGGVKERARKSARGAAVRVDVLACPLCGHVAPTTDTLAHHLSYTHGLTARVVYGATCPLCGHEAKGQGLGVHVARKHKLGGVAYAFARATADGDPLGVVAARATAVAELVAATPVEA